MLRRQLRTPVLHIAPKMGWGPGTVVCGTEQRMPRWLGPLLALTTHREMAHRHSLCAVFFFQWKWREARNFPWDLTIIAENPFPLNSLYFTETLSPNSTLFLCIWKWLKCLGVILGCMVVLGRGSFSYVYCGEFGEAIELFKITEANRKQNTIFRRIYFY